MGKLNHTEILNEILRPSFSFLFYMVLIDVLTYLILWYCQWLIEVIFSVEAYGCEGNRYQNVVTCPTVGLRSSISCCCSVVKSCLTLCNPMDCSTPGSSVLHHLLEFAQILVH